MDYRYINQLLERYWKCETSLEEEEILRAFFSQKDIPAELIKYRDLFSYEQEELKSNVLGKDFDAKVMSKIDDEAPIKARTITMATRLMPLFKAAAVVAIILTLGNAMQMPFNSTTPQTATVPSTMGTSQGVSVAMTDSAVVDTMQQSSIEPAAIQDIKILK